MGCIETESLPVCYEYKELNMFYPMNDFNAYVLIILNIFALSLNLILFFGFR